MTFASVNTWAYNDELTYTQMNTLNTNLTNAVDGLGGGTYTPTAKIIVAGAFGLKVSGLFEVSSVGVMSGGFITSGVVQFGAAVQITSGNTFTLAAGSALSAANTSNITLAAGSTFYSNTELTLKAGFGTVRWETGTFGTFASGSTLLLSNGSTVTGVAGSTVNLAGTTTLSGATSLAGPTTVPSGGVLSVSSGGTLSTAAGATCSLGSTVTCTGTVNLNGTTNINGAVAVSGITITIGSGGVISCSSGAGITIASGATETVQGKLTYSSGGHAVYRYATNAGTANTNYTTSDADYVYYTALTSSRDANLKNTGAQAGCVIEFSVMGVGSSNVLSVKDDGGGLLLNMINTAGAAGYGKFIHNGTDWKLFGYSLV